MKRKKTGQWQTAHVISSENSLLKRSTNSLIFPPKEVRGFKEWKVQDMSVSSSEIDEDANERVENENDENIPFTAHGQEGEQILPGQPSAPPPGTVRVNDSAPSRNREMQGMLNMAATGVQPAGKALPPLLPDRILSIVDYVSFAVNLNPRNFLMREAIPHFAWCIAQSIHANADSVIEKRTAALAYMRNLKAALKGANERRLTMLPPGSPSCGADFSLIRFLIVNLKYPDTSFAVDLRRGMQLAGEIPGAGVFTARERAHRAPMPEWRNGLEDRNRAMAHRVTHSASSPLTQVCWAKTLEEVEKGWISQPAPVSEDVIRSIPLSPRFAIEEQHGEWSKKVRVIDDFKASMVNDLLGLVDTNIPQNLATLLGMALTHAQFRDRQNLQVFSLDFSNAYKHVGVAPDQMDFATVVLSDPNGNAMMATLRTQPIGSTRAPANWARVTSFVQFVLRKVILVWIGVFVDDCYCVEPQNTIASALWVTRELCALLGLRLEHSKQHLPEAAVNIIGASIHLGADLVTASIAAKRVEDYVGVLKGIIRRNNLSPVAAAKIRGRLGFAQSTLFLEVWESNAARIYCSPVLYHTFVIL